ncbi:MAG: polyprenol monophosphomannose synthase [Desulfurococcaceae archaeon]
MIEVSIILPTYNERENIARLVESINRHMNSSKFEIIVVDDNSPDGTADIAMELSRLYPVKVIKRSGKLGLTSAIHEGISTARGKIVVVMDADLQHPPHLIPKLTSRVGECDIVIASRYISGGRVEGLNPWRKAVSLAAVFLTRLLIPKCRKIKDPVSGFFAARRDILSSWSPIVPRGYKALVEILSLLKTSNICEEPYVFAARKTGSSKLSFRVVLAYVETLLKLGLTSL